MPYPTLPRNNVSVALTFFRRFRPDDDPRTVRPFAVELFVRFFERTPEDFFLLIGFALGTIGKKSSACCPFLLRFAIIRASVNIYIIVIEFLIHHLQPVRKSVDLFFGKFFRRGAKDEISTVVGKFPLIGLPRNDRNLFFRMIPLQLAEVPFRQRKRSVLAVESHGYTLGRFVRTVNLDFEIRPRIAFPGVRRSSANDNNLIPFLKVFRPARLNRHH